ncbi:MAG: hypothetical protein SGI74_00150 [Oligoflexia bacterium]|nr:hypothetical protein [Oligoflexia bacterium]
MIYFSVLLFALLLPQSVSAAQIAERFNDTRYHDANTTTAVWNYVLHFIHPQIYVDRSSGSGADNANDLVNIGDGRHGPFNITTFSKFSENGSTSGNIITINTDIYTSLQFTTFDLPTGWTLKGKGSLPLIMRIMGDVVIAGIIDCRGDIGTAGGGSISVVPRGGTGRCGGGSGGNGSIGATSAVGTSSTAGGAGGGAGVDHAADPRGGGGGGGNSSSGGSNGAGTPAGGVAGVSALDSYLDTFTYGAGSGGGGGGGGGYNTGGFIAGGGGGAGGGIIRLFVGGNVTLTGSILATGGNGGVTAGNGGGGGGAGGIVSLFTPNSITGGGTIDAQGGVGGSGGGNGDGAPGNTWIAFGVTGTFSNTPNFDGPDAGEVIYRSGFSHVAQSLPIDTANSSPTYTAFVKEDVIPGTSTINFKVAGSNDGFNSDNTGWISATAISILKGKRWYRYRLTFNYLPTVPQTAPIPTPLKINVVAAKYEGHQTTNFDFTPACGKLSGPGEFFLLLLMCNLGGLITTGRLRRGFQSHRPKKISLS